MRLQRSLPVLAISVVLLSGCGVAGTEFHPGIAAQVGDDTITTRHVDQVTDDYCQAVEKVSKDQGQTGAQRTPLRYLTHDFANVLIVEAAAQQLADEYDVRPSATYKSGVAQLEPQLTKLDESEKDAVREVIGARAYATDVLSTIGGIELAKQGNDAATADEKTKAGDEALKAWEADHDVVINPKYGLDFNDPTPVDTDLSYALGTTAKAGLADQPDTSYTNALPDSLTCLD